MTTASKPILFNSVQAAYDFSDLKAPLEGQMRVQAHQEITPDLIDRIKSKREYQDARTFSELTKGDDLEMIQIAEIPAAVVWKWRREGFDIADVVRDNPGPQAAQLILAKLRSEDLTAFQTTSKTF